MEGVSIMAVSPLSSSADPPGDTIDQRRQALVEAIAMKRRLGYEVESETEFGAVVFTPSPRRWLGMRDGRENQRLTIAINARSETTTSRV
jgi:hypothetical protein